MKKNDDVRYCLYDVKWAYTDDGVFTVPFIWNKDRTKIKTLVDGAIFDVEVPGDKGKGTTSQFMYLNAVKKLLTKTIGTRIDNICNTQHVINECHNEKVKKGAIMRCFEWKKMKEEFRCGRGSSFGYSSIFVEDNRYNVEDLLALGDNFSKVLGRDYQERMAEKENLEPNYLEF